MNRFRRSPQNRTTAVLLLCGVYLTAGCRPSPTPPRPTLPAPSNILLITIDTLRADHLSSYGYARNTSPTLDRLATEGVRFDQASVQWPKTGPSFASMFTGTYGKDNDIVRQVGLPLSCRFQMLAELLQRQGYGTHAVVSNGALAREFFFDQGFETYVETWKLQPPGGITDPNGAEAVTRLATGILDKLDGSRPWFLWVHYLDPHTPYEPPASHRDLFQNDELYDPSIKVHIFEEKSTNQMYGIGADQVLDGRDELDVDRARYDAEIAYTDQRISELLTAMEARRLMDRTLTVVTSDHGESLGEHHYYFDHGRFAFDTCLRVPLILHFPGVIAPGVEAEPTALIDLAPTLLEAAGVDLEDGAWMQGRSLSPYLLGSPRSPTERMAFSEAGYETAGKWQKVVRSGGYKLIFAASPTDQRWIGGEGVPFVLYDLHADPFETTNVAEAHPERLEELKRELWRWNEAQPFPVFRDPPGCGEPTTMEPETRELLERLGYL